ncbi:hypothetical protein [Myxosarcina sp. GI1(2024)]
MQSAFIAIRLAAGLAVGFWGLSKLLFVQSWVGPYQNVFYKTLPFTAPLWVYLLGIVQLVLAGAIVFNYFRKPAAWSAVVFSVVNLVVSFAALTRPENPIVANPAPLGIKLIWFFFNPIAITLLLIGVGLMPDVRARKTD